MRVAVTGAAGFLGLNVVNALLAQGDEVVAIDRMTVDAVSTSSTSGDVDGVSTGSTSGDVDGVSTGSTSGDVDGVSTSSTSGDVDGVSTGSTSGDVDAVSTGSTSGDVDGVSTGSTSGDVDGVSTSSTSGDVDAVSTGSTSGDVTWIEADVLDEAAITRALDGVEVVHHLVAVISLRQEDPVAWRVNTEGVATVARAALKAGVRRMVSCGSLASYHYERHGTVHEGSPRSTDPRLPVYHRSKYYGEVELRTVIDAGLDAVICNPTGIYGPVDHVGRLSRMNQAMLEAAQGRMPVGVTGEFDMVDVRDVAQGFLLAAEKGRTGHNYLLGGHRFGLAESQRLAAALAGQKGPRVLLPVRALEAVAPFLDPIARRFGSESFAPAALENVAMSPVVDRSKAGAELGYEPRPADETIADLVAFFREQRLL